jgi:hypothetical protein
MGAEKNMSALGSFKSYLFRLLVPLIFFCKVKVFFSQKTNISQYCIFLSVSVFLANKIPKFLFLCKKTQKIK